MNLEDSSAASPIKLRDFLMGNEYSHLTWFPNKGVNKIYEFKAKQVPSNNEVINKIIPYEHIIKEPYMQYLARWSLLAINYLKNQGWEWIEVDFMKRHEYNANLPIYSREFLDLWYIALPSEDQADTKNKFKTLFTELWIPIENTETVYDMLLELWEEEPEAAGNMGIEIYAAKASPFWMSMGYKQDVIRVDPYWFEDNKYGDMHGFFDKFWQKFLNSKELNNVRLHWGKYHPKAGAVYDGIPYGPKYFRKVYPKFDEWCALRERYDP